MKLRERESRETLGELKEDGGMINLHINYLKLQIMKKYGAFNNKKKCFKN